jgi:hypothetical protein
MGLLCEQIDLIQGRVSKGIFLAHYLGEEMKTFSFFSLNQTFRGYYKSIIAQTINLHFENINDRRI